MKRNSDDCASLKTALSVLIQQLGGLDAAVTCTRVRRSTLSEYTAPHLDKFAPVDVVLDLERIAQEPLLTAALARLQGFELLPVLAGERGEVAGALQKVASDTGILMADTIAALREGVVARKDRARIDEDLERLVRHAQAARRIIAQLGDKPDAPARVHALRGGE